MPDELKADLNEFTRFGASLKGDEKSEAQTFLFHLFQPPFPPRTGRGPRVRCRFLAVSCFRAYSSIFCCLLSGRDAVTTLANIAPNSLFKPSQLASMGRFAIPKTPINIGLGRLGRLARLNFPSAGGEKTSGLAAPTCRAEVSRKRESDAGGSPPTALRLSPWACRFRVIGVIRGE